jgi:2-amino-4-hydroxy-6-hydroxymethyldihydropteridine diphosphokinase
VNHIPLYLYLLMNSINTAYLLLGSNIGDRNGFLSLAIELIDKEAGKIVSQSSLYNTSPWGITHQEDYLNQAICIETSFSAHELLTTILDIEKKIGRTRIKKWEARTIDIDILFFNYDIINTNTLTIPHPYLHQRRFALQPMAEIEGEYIHPVLNKSVLLLLSECDQCLLVTPV